CGWNRWRQQATLGRTNNQCRTSYTLKFQLYTGYILQDMIRGRTVRCNSLGWHCHVIHSGNLREDLYTFFDILPLPYQMSLKNPSTVFCNVASQLLRKLWFHKE
ncbi:unnamed protein product, partial [Brassica oleracea]